MLSSDDSTDEDVPRTNYGYGWGNNPAPASFGYPSYPPPPQPNPVFYGYPPVSMYPQLPTAPPFTGETASPPIPVISAADGTGATYPPMGFNPALLHDAAKSYTECPVCFEVLMAPIYQCSNGHVICNECINHLEECAQCRVPLTDPKIRNVPLEQICQKMEVKCPNHFEGCEVVTTVEHLKSHLEICDFRAMPLCSNYLGWVNCADKVTFTNVIDHLRDTHLVEVVEQSAINLNLIAPASDFKYQTSQGIFWSPIVITGALDVNILVKCLTSPKGEFIIAGYVLGGEDGHYKNYRIKIQLNSNSKLARMEWTGCLISCRNQDHISSVPNLNTFRVPLASLAEYLKIAQSDEDDAVPPDEQYKLKVKLAIWKHSEEDMSPYKKECFQDDVTGENLPLDKVQLFSKPPGEEGHFYPEAVPAYPFPEVHDHSSASTASMDSECSNCDKPIYGVLYQCLQCPPPTYFCRHCIEVGRTHDEHLTIRIYNPDKIPVAAVVYDCASGEFS